MTTISPMMQQYHDAKAACGDALLLFRMGDFYELFHEDAKTAARILGLTLTSRDKGENPVPMAGFPYHQLEGYLVKLIAQGIRVGICEQVEDPKQAKGLVKRELTRVVTPGTLTDEALLDPRESNYLAALVLDKESLIKQPTSAVVGLAWIELSTGRFLAASFPAARLADELARIAPSECLVNQDVAELVPQVAIEKMIVTKRPAWAFSRATADERIAKQFGPHAREGFGFEAGDDFGLRAAGAILDYLHETQKTKLDHIDRLLPYRTGQSLEIDEATRRSLEITRSLRGGGREGSLLSAIDRTVTPMGSRLLAEWISAPLADVSSIELRLGAVEELVADGPLRDACREQLKGMYDLQRLLARVSTGRASPRDLSFVGRTLASLPKLKAKLTGRKSPLIHQLEAEIDLCPELRAKLEAALEDDCPLGPRDGSFIRAGFSGQLDELRELMRGGKQWMARFQAEEIERSGITSLKVGFTSVFGYYIEITNTHREKIPVNYIRKQTLKNAERYITPELKEYEEKILTAEEKCKELEYQLFIELRDMVEVCSRRLQGTANAVAQLDVLGSLSELARSRSYCRPVIVEEPVLDIVDGRHPVVDLVRTDGSFVPNDTKAGPGEEGLILLITGPNMAGKSTYIRQVALITLLAQVGSFVPARKATIGIADRIYARVGASDELARGQSTFMVEMIETARILNGATNRSLVILDEIGRGTSTYDGVSLAWSVVEYLHDRIHCRTLFATHYHELTDLATSLSGVVNLNVSVREWDDQVVFLHKIVAGSADKSYGIHVARLAGVPREVNDRAKQILAQLESEHLGDDGRPKIARKTKRPRGDLQLTLFGPVEHPLLEELRALDIDNLPPIEALKRLHAWQDQLKAEKK